jgi:hypothetical protein
VAFTGNDEYFSPNISDELLATFKDANGDIRFERVFEWMLPRFGEDEDVEYYDFIAARMRNYMIHIMRTKNFKPKYFNPAINLTIQADHVARFYGCHMGRMLCGFPSIEGHGPLGSRSMLSEPSRIVSRKMRTSTCIDACTFLTTGNWRMRRTEEE